MSNVHTPLWIVLCIARRYSIRNGWHEYVREMANISVSFRACRPKPLRCSHRNNFSFATFRALSPFADDRAKFSIPDYDTFILSRKRYVEVRVICESTLNRCHWVLDFAWLNFGVFFFFFYLTLILSLECKVQRKILVVWYKLLLQAIIILQTRFLQSFWNNSSRRFSKLCSVKKLLLETKLTHR